MTSMDHDSLTGKAATLIGWGSSTMLNQSQVTIFSQAYCNYTREGNKRPGRLQDLFQDNVLCAGKIIFIAILYPHLLHTLGYQIIVQDGKIIV